MRKEYLFLIGGVIFFMAALYWQDHYFGANNMQPSQGSAPVEDTGTSPAVPQESFTAQATATALDNTTTQSNSADAHVSRAFAAALKEISACLQITNDINGDQVEPTMENLMNSLKTGLGEMTVYTDDWTQTDVVYTDGVKKRIRTEINYDQPGNPTKYLQVYKMSDQGIPEIEEMDAAQSTNPSDDYIESLKTGSNVVLSEKGGRAYFQGGEEMAIIEQNGKIDSFTMTKNNKTINCSSITSASSCQCY